VDVVVLITVVKTVEVAGGSVVVFLEVVWTYMSVEKY